MAGDPASTRRRTRARRRGGDRGLHAEVVSGLDRRSRPPLGGLARWLEGAAPPGVSGQVAVCVTTDTRVRALNRRYRGQDRVTDVLSFPSGSHRRVLGAAFPGTRLFLGDIVIAVGRARRQAREARHALATELRILSLHGLLHLLGYDHSTDHGLMAKVEEALRRRAGLREGLIERAGGGARVADDASRRGRAGGVP